MKKIYKAPEMEITTFDFDNITNLTTSAGVQAINTEYDFATIKNDL